MGNDLTTPVAAYQNQDISHLLVHNADRYLYRLAYMALEQSVSWPKDQDFNSMEDIRAIVAFVCVSSSLVFQYPSQKGFHQEIQMTLRNIRINGVFRG